MSRSRPRHAAVHVPPQQRRRRWLLLACAAVGLALVIAAFVTRQSAGPGASGSPAASGAADDAAAQGHGSEDDAGQPATLPGPRVTAPPQAPPIPSDPADIGVLVNKDHGLSPRTFAPKDLVRAKDGSAKEERLRKEAMHALDGLRQDAKKAGHPLAIISGYRSYADQESLHRSYVDSTGKRKADAFSAQPGFSEHQTGLAVDVGNTDGKCTLRQCFGSTPAGRWVAQHAAEHGFIVRYPQGEQKTTGYTWEPWHLRYVGPSLAQRMAQGKVPTLEAYYGEER